MSSRHCYGRAVNLQRRISERESELLFFALTPPRQATPPEKAQEIADVTAKRLAPLDLDGLVLYDIDDESDRNPEERPFPFLPTMDPAQYLDRHLTDWDVPAVVYRAVGKYAEPDLRSWLDQQDPNGSCRSSSGRPRATSRSRRRSPAPRSCDPSPSPTS